MAQVSDLARFVLSQNPQENLPQLCVYNFFKNRQNLDQSLTPAMILEFFAAALIFPHWQTNKEELANELFQLLTSLSNEMALNFEVKDIPDLKDVQVVGIEQESNLLEIITKHTQRTLFQGQKFRIIPDEDRGMVALLLNEDQSLTVKSYGKFAFIQRGELWPVHPLQQLHYDASLELTLNVPQIVEISPFAFAKFSRTNGGLKGIVTKGFSFQKSDIIDVLTLNQVPGLFFSVKRMERFFINRASEPVYREILEALENSIALLQSPTAESIRLATESYQKAQHIYQHIFPDDKMLFLLIRDLARTLTSLKSSSETAARLDARPHVSAANPQKRDDECESLIPIL